MRFRRLSAGMAPRLAARPPRPLNHSTVQKHSMSSIASGAACKGERYTPSYTIPYAMLPYGICQPSLAYLRRGQNGLVAPRGVGWVMKVSASFFPWLVTGPSMGRMTWVRLPRRTPCWAGRAGWEADSDHTVDRRGYGCPAVPQADARLALPGCALAGCTLAACERRGGCGQRGGCALAACTGSVQ
jgi:hypothetical protein